VSLYCRGLRRAAELLRPAEARAQIPTRTPSPVYIPPPSQSITHEDHRVNSARIRAASYSVEIQKKLAISAACIVFALVGVPVGLRFPRGGVGLVIGMSLAVFTIYYVGLIGGEELGDRLILSPFLAMWIPNIVFGVLGLVGLWVVRREGSTARGGDWADLRDALLLRLRRQRRSGP
jgi:lipopolysaccharide export system permease protein